MGRQRRVEAGALLFDMDGLMIDSEPVWHVVEHELGRALGVEWTEALSHACIGTGLPNTIEMMRAHLGVTIGIEEGVERLVEGFLGHLSDLRLQPGCQELVDAASGRLPLAVASSSTRRLVTAVLDHFTLADRFAAVVSGEAVVRTKPAPDIFLVAAERLGRAPADCVVLEDSTAGVRAAVAAGMRVIAVPETDPAPFASLTDLVVADLHAARGLLGL